MEQCREIDKKFIEHDSSKDISMQSFSQKRKSSVRVEDTTSVKWHLSGEGNFIECCSFPDEKKMKSEYVKILKFYFFNLTKSLPARSFHCTPY